MVKEQTSKWHLQKEAPYQRNAEGKEASPNPYGSSVKQQSLLDNNKDAK